jgi:hypothetical protein
MGCSAERAESCIDHRHNDVGGLPSPAIDSKVAQPIDSSATSESGVTIAHGRIDTNRYRAPVGQSSSRYYLILPSCCRHDDEVDKKSQESSQMNCILVVPFFEMPDFPARHRGTDSS